MRFELPGVARHGRSSHALARVPGRVLAPALVALGLIACQPETSDEPAAEADAPAQAAPGDQQPGGAAMQQQMALVTELQSIDQALDPIRQQAQQNPEIAAQEAALVARVDSAMESISPGVLDARARFETLQQEYAEAQQAGEEERVAELGTELQGLQARISETQSQALQRQDVASAVESFREELFDWMREADPQVDSLLDRAEEITSELEGAMEEGDGP